MAATNLNHVSIVARDLEESIRFYEELFGMERVATPNFGFPVQWLRVGPIQLHLFERGDDAPVYHHIGLTVDDLASVFYRAKEMGIHDYETFGHHLYELPGNIAQMYLRDPSGNMIEVDAQDASSLPEDVLSEMRKLADKNPQSEENMQARLFLEHASR